MVIEKSKKRTAAQSCTASVSNAVSHDDSEYTARKRSINDSSVYQKALGRRAAIAMALRQAILSNRPTLSMDPTIQHRKRSDRALLIHARVRLVQSALCLYFRKMCLLGISFPTFFAAIGLTTRARLAVRI